jgi:hypothetical protein
MGNTVTLALSGDEQVVTDYTVDITLGTGSV